MNTTTLKGLNAARQQKESVSLDGAKLKEVYAVGTVGATDGQRSHLLFVEVVLDAGKSDRKAGDFYAVEVACNSHAEGTVVPEWDLKDLTCSKCDKILDRIKKNLRRQP